ncbi:hypothetical protein Taro_053709, partial [Colocasia esculenta]|nr:hypothetical protein [Colocasia esculenta]
LATVRRSHGGGPWGTVVPPAGVVVVCGDPVRLLTCQDRTPDLASPAFCNPANKLCGVSLSYADGSAADGDLASDICRVGHSPPLRALFSCVGYTMSSSGEDAVTAGILGMNRGGDSAALPFPVPLNYTPLIQISLPLLYFDRVAYSVQLEASVSEAPSSPSPSPSSSPTTPAPARPLSTPVASSPSSS